jgi:hypothetical protein
MTGMTREPAWTAGDACFAHDGHSRIYLFLLSRSRHVSAISLDGRHPQLVRAWHVLQRRTPCMGTTNAWRPRRPPVCPRSVSLWACGPSSRRTMTRYAGDIIEITADEDGLLGSGHRHYDTTQDSHAELEARPLI